MSFANNNTLQEHQSILTYAEVSNYSDFSFNMGVYENFFYYFERNKEICSTQEKCNI